MSDKRSLALAELNAMPAARFVEHLSKVFEHSPSATSPFTIHRIVGMEYRFLPPTDICAETTAENLAVYRHWFEPHALCPETGKLIFMRSDIPIISAANCPTKRDHLTNKMN